MSSDWRIADAADEESLAGAKAGAAGDPQNLVLNSGWSGGVSSLMGWISGEAILGPPGLFFTS